MQEQRRRTEQHAATLVSCCIVSAAAGCGAPDGAYDHATGVDLKTRVEFCPMIASFTVAPSEATVGHNVELTAAAVDPDSDKVSFSWTPSVGSVANPRAAKTTYRCYLPGKMTLTLTVADEHCSDSDTAAVLCSPAPEPRDAGAEAGHEGDAEADR